MIDPVYALMTAALALPLLIATAIPAPARSTDDEDGIVSGLIVAACAAALAMGVLALLGHPAESTVLGALAWLLVMPCVWLARAPQSFDDGYDDEDDGKGGAGGSPSPRDPSGPAAPDDHRLPGLQAPAAVAPPVTWTPAPQAAPVMATAACMRHHPARPRLRPAPRGRGDHRTITHVQAEVAHARTRRQTARRAKPRTPA